MLPSCAGSALLPWAVWANEIGGYEYNPPQAGHTWNIERCYRADR